MLLATYIMLLATYIMFALFEDAFLIPLFPQAYSLRLLRQRLWTFAAFGDGNTFLPHTLISTSSSSQEMNIYAKTQTKMHKYTIHGFHISSHNIY